LIYFIKSILYKAIMNVNYKLLFSFFMYICLKKEMQYSFNSEKEPTLVQLKQIMKEVANEAKEKSDLAHKIFFKALQRKAQNIKNEKP